MPAILLSPTFWKFLGIGVLVLALSVGVYAGIAHYNHLKEQAALVPGLQADNKSLHDQLTTNDGRVAKALVDLQIAQGQLAQARADLQNWKDLKTTLNASLTEMSKNASATVNAICLPSSAERLLWNTTLAKLTGGHAGAGQTGAAGKVPQGAAGAH